MSFSCQTIYSDPLFPHRTKRTCPHFFFLHIYNVDGIPFSLPWTKLWFTCGFFFFFLIKIKKDKITYATSQSLRKYSHKNISNLYAKPSIVKVKTT